MNDKFTVWIIDDDVVSKYVMKRNLKELNILNVVDFPDSEKPLQILNDYLLHPQDLPDLIFLDMNMPFMDGFQFLEAYENIKHHINQTIQIYMLSSSINPEDRLKAKSFSSVVDFLIKPIDHKLVQQLLYPVPQD